jgi:hypothetical protein
LNRLGISDSEKQPRGFYINERFRKTGFSASPAHRFCLPESLLTLPSSGRFGLAQFANVRSLLRNPDEATLTI